MKKEAKSGTMDLMGDIKNSISLFSYKKDFCSFFFVLSCLFWSNKVSKPGLRLFYKEILKVPTSMSIQAGAVLAGAFALGRFLSGFFF